VIPARQDEHETLQTLFKNVDLSFANKTIKQCYHQNGPGRPPRNPSGIFRAFLIMKMKAIQSLREMTRILNTDQRIRKLCLLTNVYTNRAILEKSSAVVFQESGAALLANLFNFFKQNEN